MFRTLKFVVKDDERAFLLRDGRFEQFLPPGRHSFFGRTGRLSAEIVKVLRAEMPVDRAALYEATQPAFVAQNLEIVRNGVNEVAIVSLDGEPRHLVTPGQTRVFWKTITKIEVEKIDVASQVRIPKSVLDRLNLSTTSTVLVADIAQHDVGLLFVDGTFVEQLAPGRHAFWQVNRVVKVLTYDTRAKAQEITAQEIMTKDRIAVRVTLTAFTRVADPLLLATSTADPTETIHKLVQFAVREAVATRTLDEILGARDSVDAEIRDYVTSRSEKFGVAIGEIGIKDVILPGDVRDLINKVVDAERTARANQIRRQEETAATRSLLNTARLMEDNPLLLRLKELESLEKLVEKVGRIDLHSSQGQGFESLLTRLYSLKDTDKA